MTQAVSQATEDDSHANHPTFLDTVQETHHFVASLKHKMFVVKLGGSTLEYQRAVLQDLIWLHDLGVKVVLVHGGGPSITAWLQKLHIPTRFEQGMRVTAAQTLEVVRMVLYGQINQELVTLASVVRIAIWFKHISPTTVSVWWVRSTRSTRAWCYI